MLLTAAGDVPLERAIFAAQCTPPAAVERLSARAIVRVAGEERPDPATAMGVLRYEYGVRRLLCESGTALNGAIVAARLLDELLLTLAPPLAGPPLRAPVPLALRSLHAHEGELYLRYQGDGRRMTRGEFLKYWWNNGAVFWRATGTIYLQ